MRRLILSLLLIFLLAVEIHNVGGGARRDARKRRSRSHVCFSVKNAVQNACVCLRVLMGTSSYALATITGRLREVDQNALDFL
ncbi:hypothetical protein C2S51_035047 [Perilla frutescens var. frutescens]|nr:hypothetical protein C2S51_035047 [Perilla frutescens var. frutescens]